ncbi:MAG TPA: lactate utilization protein [Candidatus Lokiarchaeia archaeon]|nr:lactate utilization protein [Candidatus Lokiarchaeia archaeon]
MAAKNVTKWAKMPSPETVDNTAAAIEERGFNVIRVDTKDEAFEKLKEILPDGAEVMTGSSTTLYQIGFMDYYISGDNPWVRLGPEIFTEKDPQVQATLRRKAVTAEYMLGSVNAIAETGELVACDMSGSRVSAYPFAAKNLILVAGVQKITRNLQEAMQRVREYVLPLESERAMNAYGIPSGLGKWVILEHEYNPNRITVMLVNEALGF